MFLHYFRLALLAAVISSLLGGADLGAQQPVKSSFDEKTVGDFYRGKTIRIIIGSGAGGTYDIYSRLLAKHMPKFIPGNPTLLVVPRAGAGGLIAANAVYNSEPKDGTVIGVCRGTKRDAPYSPRVGEPKLVAQRIDGQFRHWIVLLRERRIRFELRGGRRKMNHRPLAE